MFLPEPIPDARTALLQEVGELNRQLLMVVQGFVDELGGNEDDGGPVYAILFATCEELRAQPGRIMDWTLVDAEGNRLGRVIVARPLRGDVVELRPRVTIRVERYTGASS